MAHYFLAIQLPEQLSEYYQGWQDELKQCFHYKKWTAKADLHITLSFLGAVEAKQLQLLKDRLEMLRMPSSFPITLGSLGVFGQGNRPRVLFVDIHPNEELQELQRHIVKATENVGFVSEKRAYRPHVTLAKKWSSSERMREGQLEELRTSFSTTQVFDVSAVTLYQIHPQRVPSYEVVAVFPLRT